MAEFSIQDAAFTGFRVVREHPRALAVWSLYALVLSLILEAILVGLMGPDLNRVMAISQHQPADTAGLGALFARIAPAYLVFILVGMVMNAILGAAMIRAVLRPEEERFGFLRLGADELRQFGLALLVSVVLLGVYFGLVIVLVLLSAIAGAASGPLAGVVLALGIVSILGVLIMLAVRLSLAPTLTFVNGRISLTASWEITRGRFWPLLGTYLLTFALVGVVYFLSVLVIAAVIALLSGGDLGTVQKAPDLGSLTAYFTPMRLVQTTLMSVVSALLWPVLFTPPTAIYRSLAPPGLAAADVFS